ncbi:exocyst complex component exo70 [Dispira simplex]|nr:exocyst complex component exo70 [Dispira simplex]
MASTHVNNYLDLDEENDELSFLQESLEQINQLSQRGSRILAHFDQRLVRLESLVQPIRQSSQSLGTLQQNVNDTIDALKSMMKYFDCVREEEPIISQGPQENDLLPYLRSINNLQLANDFVTQVNMRSADRLSKQIRKLLEKGLEHLNNLFRKWLQQYSTPIDPTQYDSPLDIPRPPPATLRLLEMLVTYLSASETEIGTRIDYGATLYDIRSTYVLKSMEPLIAATDNVRTQASATMYQKGTSPVIPMTSGLIKLAQAEKDFIETIMPGTTAEEIFLKTVKPVVARYLKSIEGLLQVAKRSIQTEKFMLFDVFETLKHYQNELDRALNLTPTEKKTLANLMASISTPIMTSFAEYMEEARQMTKLGMPQDGTISEFSSSVLNHMKRLLDHQETVESMMVTLGDGHWGSSSANTVRKTFSGEAILKHYFQDLLRLLVGSLESKTKGSRRQEVSIVFLMNNYHYIAKSISQSRLREIFGEHDLQNYEELDWKYQEQYCRIWGSCVAYLVDDPTGPGGLKHKLVGADKMTIKDKFKHFNGTLDDVIRSQQSCTIPDSELRRSLLDRVRQVLIPAYVSFMEKYQHTEFAKNSGKYVRYTQDSLDRVLQSVFK